MIFLCFPIELLIARIYFNSGLSSSKLLPEMKGFVYTIVDYLKLEYFYFLFWRMSYSLNKELNKMSFLYQTWLHFLYFTKNYIKRYSSSTHIICLQNAIDAEWIRYRENCDRLFA